jgi:uncharacterized protein (DUF1800 family)
MNSAIMAVTKSAYATFQAPPWWPPVARFFPLMTKWAAAEAEVERLQVAVPSTMPP